MDFNCYFVAMKPLLLILCLPLALFLHAQEKFYEEPIGWRGSDIELHTISDHDKHQNCLFLCNDDSVRAFVLNNQKTIIQRFYLNRLKGEDFLGGFMKDGKVYAYFQSSGGGDLHRWVLDIAEGVGNDTLLPFAMRHERAVEQINCGDHFLYFTANRKASQFAIYDFREGNVVDTLHYQFEEGVWKALTHLDGGLSREMNVICVDPDDLLNPDMAHIPNKLYWRRDSLFLLMNGLEEGVTAVYSFDMRNKKVDVRKITHNNVLKLDPPLTDYVDNSMLLDDRLYFVSAEDAKLNVQVRDFYSGRLLKQFTAVRDSEIAFKNTPIIQEGSFYHPGGRELGKTRQLIRKMVSGTAVLLAMGQDSGRVELTVGAWQHMASNGPMGPFARPGLNLFISPTSLLHPSNIRSSRFKMLVDGTSFEHVPGSVAMDISDRIEEYTKGVSIPSKGESLFSNNGRPVYAYYSRDAHSIVLSGF